ncbi:MAG: TCR/Tet family MFS transporter [Chitinophagaceae bacterium]|nr:TCR/Tet family MFS transporter [Oligoflexus sp.]
MPRIQFIFITIFLDSLGIGLLVPVLPDILRRFTTDAGEVSLYYGYFLSAYAAIQFLASPVLGSLSDRFGRRPVLLVSLLGAGIDYILMAVAPTLSILFIGRAISGLTGASMTVASSYMADISDDSNRSKNFGLIGAAWGLGFIIGPVLGGIFEAFGHSGPFVAAAVMNLLNFAFGFFILPESLAAHHRRPLSFRSMNPFLSLIKVLKPSSVSIFIWIYFLVYFAGQVHAVNWTLYTQLKFGWTAWQVGLSLAFVGITNAASQTLLPRYLVPKIGEYRAFLVGLVICAITFMMFGFVTRPWMVYPVIAMYALSAMAFPALQSIISKETPPSEQGELQGSLVSLGSICAVIAPFFFTQIFMKFTEPHTSYYFPGAAYVAAGGLCFVALLIAIPVVRRFLREQYKAKSTPV